MNRTQELSDANAKRMPESFKPNPPAAVWPYTVPPQAACFKRRRHEHMHYHSTSAHGE